MPHLSETSPADGSGGQPRSVPEGAPYHLVLAGQKRRIGRPAGSWAVADLLFMFAVTIVIVPLQSAGEEYGYRGLIFRVAGSWGRGPRSALTLGVVVSAVLFATIHLTPVVLLAVITAAVWYRTRRDGPAVTPMRASSQDAIPTAHPSDAGAHARFSAERGGAPGPRGR